MALSERIYRFLLFAYPRSFQREYGEGMVEIFRCRHKWAQTKGSIHSHLRFWAEIVKDLISRHDRRLLAGTPCGSHGTH